VLDRIGDDVELRAAGGGVEEGYAVEEEAAREGAEQEVLERGSARLGRRIRRARGATDMISSARKRRSGRSRR
jgi:hypothetical protein